MNAAPTISLSARIGAIWEDCLATAASRFTPYAAEARTTLIHVGVILMQGDITDENFVQSLVQKVTKSLLKTVCSSLWHHAILSRSGPTTFSTWRRRQASRWLSFRLIVIHIWHRTEFKWSQRCCSEAYV